MSDCPRCSEDGVMVYVAGEEGEDAIRIVVPWSVIEECISDNVNEALESLAEAGRAMAD